MADDLWDKLCAMPRPHKVVDFPRKDADGQPIGQIAMWVLTQSEQEESAAAADKRANDLLQLAKSKTPKSDEAKRGYDDLFSNAAADEILYRACRKVGDLTQAFFPTPALLRSKLTVDEVGLLMSIYYTVQDDLGPIASRLSDEEIDALIERLQKSGERHFLDFLSPDAARSLAFSLVLRLPRSSTDTSSPGSPLDESGESSKSDTASGEFDDTSGAP